MRGARRIGNTVKRSVHPNADFVHALLRWLETVGFDGAPRLIESTTTTETLTYVDGFVPVETSSDDLPPWLWEGDALESAFRLIRRYHDVTARCPLAGADEVICHGDLSPWNTVYRDGRAVAFIDWDGARSGSRLSDVAYAAWRYLRLGFPDGPNVVVAGLQLRRACESYGLADRSGLISAISHEQDRQRAWFREREQAGDEAVVQLIGRGALRYIDNAQRWLHKRRDTLEDALL